MKICALLLLCTSALAQTPSTLVLHTLTLDSGGTVFGTPGGFAGVFYYGQGTVQAVQAKSIGIVGPTTTTGYNIILPSVAPTLGQSLVVAGIPSTGQAYTKWVSGYTGTAKVSASCSLTITNGLITGKTGC